MNQGRRYGTRTRNAVVTAAKAGENQNEIAKRFGISKATIYNWVKEAEANGNATAAPKTDGVTQSFTEEARNAIYAEVLFTLVSTGQTKAAHAVIASLEMFNAANREAN